jgi:hypothetical protein
MMSPSNHSDDSTCSAIDTNPQRQTVSGVRTRSTPTNSSSGNGNGHQPQQHFFSSSPVLQQQQHVSSVMTTPQHMIGSGYKDNKRDGDNNGKRRRPSSSSTKSYRLPMLVASACLAVGTVLWMGSSGSSRSIKTDQPLNLRNDETNKKRALDTTTTSVHFEKRKDKPAKPKQASKPSVSKPSKHLKVFQPHPSIVDQADLEFGMSTLIYSSDTLEVEHVVSTLEEQRGFLETYGKECYKVEGDQDEDGPSLILEQWDAFGAAKQSPLKTLQMELWKYCSLYKYGGLFVESEALLLQPLANLQFGDSNVAVASNMYPQTLYGGWMYVSQPRSEVAQYMLSVLVETDMSQLVQDPLYLAKQAYKALHSSVQKGKWDVWGQSCHMDPMPVPSSSVSTTDTSGGAFGSVTSRTPMSAESQILGPIASQVFVPRYHRYVCALLMAVLLFISVWQILVFLTDFTAPLYFIQPIDFLNIAPDQEIIVVRFWVKVKCPSCCHDIPFFRLGPFPRSNIWPSRIFITRKILAARRKKQKQATLTIRHRHRPCHSHQFIPRRMSTIFPT